MAGLVPIPTSRIPGLLARERLIQQMQADQLSLFRLQDQVSTGRRIILPSDDAPSALRSIALQRLLERKTQLESNIATGRTFLVNTDSSLGLVADTLIGVKAATLQVVGTVTTEEQRSEAILEINQTLDSLLRTANTKFLNRYLFAGSQTSQIPFSMENGNVVYHGDAGSVQSYSNIGVLFSSNASGLSVFGGISEAVFGSIDLNPQINENTLLSSLRGGAGIKANGAFTLSDGESSSIIDVSGAVTVGDVKRLIEENVPGNRDLTVSITGTGINLQFDPGSAANAGANLIVQEVGTGTTARELGLFTSSGLDNGLLTGQDLDPVIRSTTRLDDLLGSKARAQLTSDGDYNNIQLEAAANGTAADGVTVQFVDDSLLLASSGLTAGNEVATYNANAQASTAALTFGGANNDLVITAATPGSDFNNVRIDIQSTAVGAPTAAYDSVSKVLTINLEADGTSDANQVITAVAGLPGGEFTAALDTSVESGNTGSGTLGTFTQGSFANTGNSGGDDKTLYIHIEPGSTKANNVVAAIEAEGTFTAKLDPADTTIAALAGTGLVDVTVSTTTSGGSGSTLDKASGIRVVNGGETFDITFENAENVNDLLNTLNASDAGLQAEINASGTGINIRSRLSGQDFQIGENGGTTATQLGLRSYNNDTSLNEFNYGSGVPTGEGFELPTVTGTDFTITTSDGTNIDVDLSGMTSLAEVVSAINDAALPTGGKVTASLGAPGNILELVDNTFPAGGPLTVTQATGSLAGQYLGLIPNGQPVGTAAADTLTGDDEKYVDFTITDANGQDYGIDLSAAQTVGDVIAAINAITGGPTGAVEARLAQFGNGIELVDNTGGVGQLTVSESLTAQTAEFLGLIPSGSDTANSTTGTFTGTDRNYLETDSVFTTLIRLRDALEANDTAAISRAAAKIDDDINRVTFARAEVGAREQGLIISQQNLQDEDIQIRSALSDEIDVDLVEAISNLVSRQVALEASLRVTANIMQLSLLNFI